eukprot:c8923_g1_i1.p1 GENE.c8923_g1_i1~~c8923_g1_i1.p1  ORF type:complete len:316 (+),score=49.49 c8923_g1_i1:732-1679(+)
MPSHPHLICSATFYCIFVMCLASLPCILLIPRTAIDDNLARGFVPEQDKLTNSSHQAHTDTEHSRNSHHQSESEDDLKPTTKRDHLPSFELSSPPVAEPPTASYWQVFAEGQMIVFCLSVFLFHLSNAGTLPLLTQLVGSRVEDENKKIPLAVLVILIGRITTVIVNWIIAKKVHSFGRKSLLIISFIVVPLRGCLCAIFESEMGILLALQILDGIGGGVYRVMHQVIIRDLSRGSGRFNVALGVVMTCDMASGALSNLIGQVLAQNLGYSAAFTFLAVVGFVALFVFGCFFKEPRPSENEQETRPLRQSRVGAS